MKKLVLAGLVLAILAAWTLVRRRAERTDGAHAESAAPIPTARDLSAVAALDAPTEVSEVPRVALAAGAGTTSDGESPAATVEAGVFRGLVRDALTGQPIAGASAVLVSDSFESPPRELTPDLVAATSHDDGAFELRLSPGESHGRAWLVARSYGPCAFTYFADDERALEGPEVIELLPASSLQVFVADANGKGSPQVEIELSLDRSMEWRDGHVVRGADTTWQGTTDGTGRAWFDPLPAEQTIHWKVGESARPPEGDLALAPGEAKVLEVRPPASALPPGEVERDLELIPALWISGRIVGTAEDFDALLNAAVLGPGGEIVASGELDAAGAFRVGPLAPGEYVVCGGSCRVATEALRVPAGTSDVELHVLPGCSVRVQFVPPTHDVRCSVFDLGRGGVAFWYPLNSSLECDLAPGTFAVLATARGRVGFLPHVEIGRQSAKLDVALELQPGVCCTIVHRAVDGVRRVRLFSGGEPLPVPFESNLGELIPGTSETVLVPAGELRAELLEGERVVASESVVLAPGERRRIVLEPH